MKKLIKLSLLLFTIHLSLFGISAQTEQKAELVVQTGNSEDISAVTFSTNGKLIASAARDKTVKLWDAESGLQIRDFKLNNSPFFQATDFARGNFGFGFELIKAKTRLPVIKDKTPLSKYLLSQLSQRTLNLLDEYAFENPTLQLLKSLADDVNQILKGGLLYTPERFEGLKLSNELLTLIEQNPTGDELIKLNRLLLDEVFPNDLKKADGYFYNLHFSPDSNLLAGFNGGVTVWSVITGKELFSFSGENAPMVFSPDGKLLAVSDYIGEIALYDTTTGFPVKRLKRSTNDINQIEAMQFTLDGKTIVSIEGLQDEKNPNLTDRLNVTYWDVITGTANLTALEQTKSSQYATLFSRDKRPFVVRFNESATLLCYGTKSETQSKTQSSIFLLNLETATERKIFEPSKAWFVPPIDFIGKTLTIVDDGKLNFYSTESGTKVRDFPLEDSVENLTFSPDGLKVAITNYNKINIFNTNNGKIVKEFSNHSSQATARFSQDGKSLILERNINSFQAIDLANSSRISRFKDVNVRKAESYTVKGWNLKTGKNTETEEIDPQPDGFNLPLLARLRLLSPDEKTIALSEGKTIVIRDVDDHTIQTLEGHQDEIKFVDYSFDGKILASGSDDKTIKLWDIASGKILYTFNGYEPPDFSDEGKLPDGLNSIGFSPNAKLIAGASDNDTVTIWDVATGAEKLKLNHDNDVIAVRFNLKGDKLVTAGKDGDIKIWDVATGKQILSIKVPSEEDIYSAGFSDDGKILASGGTDKIIRLWNTTDGKLLRELSGHTGDIHFVGIGGDLIGSESSQPIVEIWDTEKGELVRTLKGYSDEIDDVVLSPDRKLLATTDDSGIVKIWEVSSGKQKFEFNKEREVKVVFSGDSTKIVGLGGGQYYISSKTFAPRHIKIWSLKDGSETYSSDFEAKTVYQDTLAVSFSAKWLSIKADATLFLLNTETKQPPLQLREKFYSYGEKVEFSPDGRYLVSGDNDGSIEVWSVETEKLITVLRGHTAQITNLNFHPNGNILLSQSSDGTTRFWDLQNKRELGKLLLLDEQDWAVISPEGLYDSSSEARKLINFVIGFEPITLEQIKDVYYVPGLLQKIFEGKSLPPIELFSKKDLFPDVEFSQPKAGQKDLMVKLTNRGGGIGQVQIKINDKEFIADARPKGFDANTKETTLTVSLKDAPLVGGKANKIEVVARNAAGSLTNRGTPRGTQIIDLSGEKTNIETPNIYAIVGGISNYTGDNLKLNFAAKDAEDFAKALEIGATKLLGDKSKVHIRLLSSNGNNSNVKFNIPDAKISTATKKDFENAFADFKNATSNDVFIVYMAGHGVSLNLNQNPNQAGGDTYLYLTQEATTTDKSVLTVENSRRAMAISSEELKDLMKQNKALKQVLILDTCAAGALSNSLVLKRDLPSDQIRAIERLKDNTGFFVLMGSSADAVSYEASQYGQGLLTYSLLRGMRGEKLDSNGYADVNELFNFAKYLVPDLAKNIGGIQQPLTITPDTSGTFDIGRFTADEQKLIVLANPKPLILRPSLQNKDKDYDDLELSRALQQKLLEANYVSGRGNGGASLVFVDADEMVDAVKPSGSYIVKGDEIIVTVRLIRNKIPLNTLTVNSKVSEKEALIKEIVAKLTEAVNLKP